MQAVRRGSEARRRGRELEELNTLGDAVALARLLTTMTMMSITIREHTEQRLLHSLAGDVARHRDRVGLARQLVHLSTMKTRPVTEKAGSRSSDRSGRLYNRSRTSSR